MIKQNLGLILICIFTSLVEGCSNQTDYNKILVRADSLMQEQPDSALYLLEGITTDNLGEIANRAYYALLLTQARDKNYILQTDDSLIQIAAHYYDTQENAAMQARAHYLWGSVYRDMNHCGNAIKEYHQAATYAKKVDANNLLGLIYNNAGLLYYTQDLNHSADSIFQLSEQLAIQRNDSNLLAEIIARRGRIKMENGADDYVEAEQMMLHALNITHSIKDTGIEATISASLSTLYGWMDLGEKSLYHAKRSLALQKDSSHNYRGLMLLGNAYYKTGQYDSAKIFLNQSLGTKSFGIKSDAYMRLADIAKNQGYMDRSIEYEKRHSIYNDSAYSTLQNVNIINTEKQLQVTEKGMLAHSLRATRNYLIVAFIVILILICTIWQYKKKNKQSKQLYSTTEAEYSIAKQQLKQKEKEISTLKKRMDILQHNDIQKEALKKDLEQLTNKRNTLTKEICEHSKVYIKMKKIIQEYKEKDKSELQFEEEDWQQLIAVTDIHWQNITLRLQEQYNLTQEDIRVCCLYLTDFPTSHLQYILGCSRDSVYRKGYIVLENKMGLSRKSASLQEVLKSFLERF